MSGVERKLDLAADAARQESELDGAAELARDQLADDTDAVSAVWRGGDGGAADLSPRDRQIRPRRMRSVAPADLHASVWGRQCAVVCRIRRQLVQYHRQRLRRRNRERDPRAADGRVGIRGVLRKLTANECGEIGAVPVMLAEQGVGIDHGSDAPTEGMNVFVERVAVPA